MFDLPTNTQASSNLLQLPAEIRLKILRLLHKRATPIENFEDIYGRREEAEYHSYTLGLSLSSQLLQCCQALYNEGQHILYHENVLVAQCSCPLNLGTEPPMCTMVDITFPMPAIHCNQQEEVHDLLSSAKYAARCTLNRGTCRKYQNRLLRFQPALLRFRQVRLIMNDMSPFAITSCCRVFRSSLLGKDLVIQAPRDKYRDTVTITDHSKCFRWLRCASIRFEGWFPDDMGEDISVITSKEPVPDFFWTAVDLALLLERNLCGHFSRSYNWHADEAQDMYEMWSAVYANDATEFARLRKIILVKALKWKEQETRDKIREINRDAEYEIRRANKGKADAESTSLNIAISSKHTEDFSDESGNHTMRFKRFKLPQNAQTASRLLQLPAEIRVITFRHLLRAAAPIEPHGVERRDGTTRVVVMRGRSHYLANLSLSTQLLGCCQTLYHQALHILYQENTLVISFTSGKYEREINVLDLSVAVPVHPFDTPANVQNLSSCVRHVEQIEVHDGSNGRPDLAKISTAMTTFNRFILRIESHLTEDVFNACRLLRKLLTQKEVTVILARQEDGFEGKFKESLNALKYLRCRSITIEDVQDDYGIDGIERVVTSNQPSADLLPSAIEMHKYLLANFKQLYPLGCLTRNDSQLGRLQNAVYASDMTAYELEKRAVLHQSLKWQQGHAQARIVAIQKNANRNIAAVGKQRDKKVAGIMRLMGQEV
ncbi:hypothetical protein OHC33_005360 [Knufia fluminis]|uniref:Uncharacterized protein n=1 Tax=Knufia fluminis TaxID=191047 RepID=A0AAN8ETK6_9EURO|nr:hypothetical protein OHC33_005360 [Knufia fluminis]